MTANRRILGRVLAALFSVLAVFGLALFAARTAEGQTTPVPGVNITYICTLPSDLGGGVFFRIANSQNVPGLRVTTTRNTGPQNAPVPPGQSYFKGSSGTTTVRFSAPGFSDREIPRAAGNFQCLATTRLQKIVEGPGPTGPYTAEVREGATTVRTFNLTAGQTSADPLPAGFVTNDYPGYTSNVTRDYTVEEVETQGADRVSYSPGQNFSLAFGTSRNITVTNTFFAPVPGVDLAYVCGLGGGEAIWRISNPQDVPDLEFTTAEGTGPQEATALSGESTFKGSDANTTVDFSAPGYDDVKIAREPGDKRCEGTLDLDKLVEGDGSAGPYEVEIRDGAGVVVDTVEVTAPDPTRITLPAGFVTDDYPGFGSSARDYTVEELDALGAVSVSYDPGQDFSLSDGDRQRITITNTFVPVPGVDLAYVCGLGGGEAIWRISNPREPPDLTVTTTQGTGPLGASVPAGDSTFRGDDATTAVRFEATGFSPTTVSQDPGGNRCQGTLELDKVVDGPGPTGPYAVEIREGADVVDTVQLTAGQGSGPITLPAGFETDDYPGYESGARGPYTVEEVGRRGADRVTYDPGQDFSLSNGDSSSITITNEFDPTPVVGLRFVCGLGGGEAIWRIINRQNPPGLTATTTQGVGPQGASVLEGTSTFRGSNATTAVRFEALGFRPTTVEQDPVDNLCEGTLALEKVVEGNGPDGPYGVEVREGTDVVDTVELSAPDTTEVTLPAGFVTDDYQGFESTARDYTVEEVETQGADRVSYDPRQNFSLSDGARRSITITNTFDPDPIVGVNLVFVCGLGGGDAIWRIANTQGVPDLNFTTTQGVGPDSVDALPGRSFFKGSDGTTTVRFSAPGFTDRSVTREAGDRSCQGTLRLDKIVNGPGPAGPYRVEIRRGGDVVDTVEVSAPDPTEATLAAGFETSDYAGFGSRAKRYTIEEVGSRGAQQVRYRPGRSFSLVDRQAVRATVVNTFGPECADLTVNVKAPNRVTAGKKFAYTITARNLGPADVDDAVLTSRLPRSVEFVRAGQDCRYDRATNKVTCNLGDVAAGTSKQRKIVVKAQRAGTVRLQGCAVKSGTPDCAPSNNQLGSTNVRSRAPTEPQEIPGVGPETRVISSPTGNSWTRSPQ